MQDKIRQKARELLSSGAVKVVIGYGEGTGSRVRALFIQRPEDADRLIMDERCVQNLAVYLTKHEVRAIGKPAIVAKMPVIRSINQLAYEEQFNEGDIAVIGISDSDELVDLPDLTSVREYAAKNPLLLTAEERAELDKLETMTREERWNYWLEELSNCIKCYACRASCPMCYCPRCTVEVNQPQWISVPAHEIGNVEWHIMRAMHLAGRCVNCGECTRACPVKIPLRLLNQRIIADIAVNFGQSEDYALAAFNPNDKEDFIR
ncbi:MAG TPA: 4Fe-4S dicluster domain-containing protein [Spirochaetota bacterium]|nr:4Fe-4S dicluster domain-containing protein [Spirochaetota bacterium]HRS79555.1 4Fe-4S dicluster domain-containing protein [Spirochaetota bacterium]HRT77493.1 4Fe-4S dicluster domain-containing protein [Spirochaetota bacterium]